MQRQAVNDGSCLKRHGNPSSKFFDCRNPQRSAEGVEDLLSELCSMVGTLNNAVDALQRRYGQ